MATPAIVRRDGYFNLTPIWQPPLVTDFSGDDRCHRNGMAFHEGKVRYTTALGMTDTPGGWRERHGGRRHPDGSAERSDRGPRLSMPRSPRDRRPCLRA